MPVGLDPCAIIRRVDVVRGSVAFRMACRPGFDYARMDHRVTLDDPRIARFTAEDGSATELASSLPLTLDGPAATGRFRLDAGQGAWFVLQPAGCGMRWEGDRVADCLAATRDFWRHWLAQSHYDGRWREMVSRSVITLKLCTYAPTGAMVAAPTCSLPESIGGNRNWDYRYRVAARLGVHRLRVPAARVLRGGPELRQLARGALPRGRPRRPRAGRSSTRSTAGATSPSTISPTSRATAARVRCASETAPTTSCSSTSTAS